MATGRALAGGEVATAAGIAAWLSGQPHVGAEAKRVTGVKGDIDHFLALVYLRGLLTVLHDAGHPGLLLVLDEVETLQGSEATRGQGAQRTPAVAGRHRRRPFSGAVPDDHRHSRVLRRQAGSSVAAAYLGILSDAVAGCLGGKVGVVPRLFLRKIVDVLDRVDEFDDFDPRRDYTLTVDARS